MVSQCDPGCREGNPLVTVAMPVYNAGRFLMLAVRSICAQTLANWELLVIDDGSTDGAVDAVVSLADPRIRVIRDGQNKGLAARLNEAIDLAKGRYFARMDQDDVSYPERFSCQVDFLESKPSVDLVATRFISISEDNEPIGTSVCPLTHDEICAKPWKGFGLPHPDWMGRTKWFCKHRYAVPGPYFCEDQELLLRTYRLSRFAVVDQVLFAYRIRRRNNWRRVIKTRWTLFTIQAKTFLPARQFGNFVLSAVYLVALIIRDLARMIREARGLAIYTAGVVADDISDPWNSVLQIVEPAQITHSRGLP